jgi:hypothetical protein
MDPNQVSRSEKYDKILQRGGMRNYALEQIREQTGGSNKQKFEVPLDRLINSKG